MPESTPSDQQPVSASRSEASEEPPAPTVTSIPSIDVGQLGPLPQNFEFVIKNPPILSRGRIDLFPDAVLEMGSYGTAVFRGSFDGHTVAVKRPLLGFVTLISRDVSTLRAAGGHPHVARYYHHETDYDFLYIALDLCPATLADVFARPDEFRDVVDTLALETRDTLRQITAGLHHLHTLDIIHRDVKPKNILMAPSDENAGPRSGLRWLLSDFGIRKKYIHNRKRLRLPKLPADLLDPTDGWCASEVIREDLEYEDPEIPRKWLAASSANGDPGAGVPMATSWLTKAVDVFALGCIYYYVLMRGRRHASGRRYYRGANVLENAPQLEELEELGEDGEVGRASIKRMLSHESCDRPNTGTCLMHPYFWDDGQRRTFLLIASERSGAMAQEAVDLELRTLEQHQHEALTAEQLSRLDGMFMEHLDEFRKYDGKPLQEVFHALAKSNATPETTFPAKPWLACDDAKGLSGILHALALAVMDRNIRENAPAPQAD